MMSKKYMNLLVWWTAVRYTILKAQLLFYINGVDLLGAIAMFSAWLLAFLMVHAINTNWNNGVLDD